MPSIIQNVEQQRALEQVTELLSVLKALTRIKPDSCDYVQLTFKSETKNARSVKVTISASDGREFSKICSAINDNKRRVIKEIRDLAKKYHITFDSKEEAMLNGDDSFASEDSDEEMYEGNIDDEIENTVEVDGTDGAEVSLEAENPTAENDVAAPETMPAPDEPIPPDEPIQNGEQNPVSQPGAERWGNPVQAPQVGTFAGAQGFTQNIPYNQPVNTWPQQ